MSTHELVIEHLKKWPQLRVEDSRIVVPTFSLYPSNSIVSAYINAGTNTAVVSDGGGAWEEIAKLGEFQFDVKQKIQKLVKKNNLSVNASGWICSAKISVEMLGAMVAIVTSASIEVAKALLEEVRAKPSNKFREELDAFLDIRFHNEMERKPRYVGASNKTHDFDYLIRVGAGKELLIDAVTPKGNSINSAVVSHLDVKQAEIEGLEQRIIFDDRDDWNASDISLLSVGAKPVAFTKLGSAIQRFVA